MIKKNDFIIRDYDCRICKQRHKIKLSKDLSENHEDHPFPYTFLHGELKNILTTLYIDQNLEVRGVEVRKLKESDLFSKDQVLTITNTLMEEIEQLREENNLLRDKLVKIEKNFSN